MLSFRIRVFRALDRLGHWQYFRVLKYVNHADTGSKKLHELH